MKKHIKYSALIAISCVVIACNSNSEPSSKNSIQEKSELASLMRVMEAHGDEVKLALRSDQSLPDRPEGIENLLMATPTLNMHIEEQTFPVFVSEYLKSVDRLYTVAKEDRKEAYNGLVRSCSNCHMVNCPGPLMKIDKMFLGESIDHN